MPILQSFKDMIVCGTSTPPTPPTKAQRIQEAKQYLKESDFNQLLMDTRSILQDSNLDIPKANHLTFCTTSIKQYMLENGIKSYTFDSKGTILTLDSNNNLQFVIPHNGAF